MNIYVDEEIQIQSFLSTNFSAMPIKWPNVKFAESNLSEFVSFNLRTTKSFPKSFGGSSVAMEHDGQLVFQIHVRPNTGKKATNAVADSLISLFHKKQLGEMYFSEFGFGASIELNEWYITNFYIYFKWKKCI